MKRILFIFILVPLLLGSTDAVPFINCNLAKKLQKALDKGVIENKIRSASVAIIDRNNRMWLSASNVYKLNTVESDTLFSIASLTKTYIAAVVFQLEEEGALRLHDTLDDWLALEIADLPNKANINTRITIRQLLNHTSGLRNFLGNPYYTWDMLHDTDRVWKPIEVLKYVNKPYFQAGQGCHYSNTNYVLLGMIIEKAEQDKINNVIKKRLLEPLGLKKTYMRFEDNIPSYYGYASGYQHNHIPSDSYDDITKYIGSGISTYTSAWTCGNMVSTAKETALFMKALMGGRKIVSRSSLKKMMTLVDGFEVNFYYKYPKRRGLGLHRIDLREYVSHDCIIWGHTGSICGYRSFMFYWPKKKLSISLLVNEKDMFFSGLDTPFNIVVDLLKVINHAY